MFKNALLVALLLVTASVQAATIFSQTPPNQTGQLSDLDYGLGVHEADDFSLDADDTVLSVTWRGFYAQSVPTDGNPPNTPLATDDFTISFYTEAGSGLPGALLQSFSVIPPPELIPDLIRVAPISTHTRPIWAWAYLLAPGSTTGFL
ncbi:MAG: hypothetical protein E2O50_03620 [Gammaproteobacteria bacterium]|nr:MAG: hypothetical protein E2O50_03620 [Gammaproteobacteria bacterium]